MVVFMDLDDSETLGLSGFKAEASASSYWPMPGFEHLLSTKPVTGPESGRVAPQILTRNNPNKTSFTAALGCYPIISEIASFIDLNTLDNLSRTCRQARENLLQFRGRLINQTLHCCNEDAEPDPEQTLRYRARAVDWYFIEEGGNNNGKVGPCARDLVSECRRCSRIVCRNCAIKPPAPILLKNRHRRLCQTCSRAPLSSLISPYLTTSLPVSEDVIQQSICLCSSDKVWLCQTCGRSLRSSDNTYESIWRWRTAYGPSLGGLGTGIGEGNRGVSCGRETECFAAHEVEQETDCDAADARSINEITNSGAGIVVSTSMGSKGPGYARHEIEGIGGVVKRKLVRMVRVGACVEEWEDEKGFGIRTPLKREREGQIRSWCGWCWRVVPGAQDK